MIDRHLNPPQSYPPLSVLIASTADVDRDSGDTDVDRVSGNAPEICNDAELRGKAPEGFDALLEREATFLTGELWGTKDRRNTQDGEWRAHSMSWERWIEGGVGDKNAPAWGFSRHPVNKTKEGACIVLGTSIGGARTAKAMQTMYAMGLDIDSGATLNAMLDKLEKLNRFCLVYTTHSHGKTLPPLPRDTVIQKLKISPDDLTDAKVHEYLRLHDKNRYEESFIQRVRITNARLETKEGEVIAVSSPPLEKYRLIFPLSEPVNIRDLAGTRGAALKVWEDKVTGLARELLGVHFDTSATDPSRLFFTARHPKAAGEDWYSAIVWGEPLRFEDVPAVRKASYARSRTHGDLNPFELAGGAGDVDQVPQCVAPSGVSLNSWHFGERGAASRFNMADLIEDHRLILTGGNGKIEIECPFEEAEHGTKGGTACMVLNPDNNSRGVWSITCQHDSCKSKHKLEFVAEMLAQNWFTEDQLFGDSVYMMDGPDEAEVIEPEAGEIAAADLQKRFRRMIRGGAGKAEKADAIRAAVKESGFGIRVITGLWDDEEKAQIQKPQGRSTIPAKSVTADYNEQVTYAQKRIVAANADAPRIFGYMDSFAVVDERQGRIRLLEDRNAFFAELAKITRWERATDDKGNVRLVSPPEDVVRFLHNDSTFKDTLPEIAGGVVTTPFFAANGSLVIEPGYHAGAGVYLAPTPGLTVPRVSGVPTAAEVAEAKRLLIEDVIADFPLGGMTRAESETATGETNAPVAHTIGYMILPFCREMIAGPTPGHVFTKPAPGTGASLLDDVCAMIDAASPAPAISPPKGDEMGKTLTSFLKDGPRRIRFDNAEEAIASGQLASAMTAPTYGARILGVSDTVNVTVRCVWGFTANNFEAEKQILRRLIFIPLDAGAADPENRIPATGWRHADLRSWVAENRGRLVWACLTLIQNWVAQGMEKQDRVTRGSYGEWAGVIGGILDAAGIDGFLLGQEAEQEKARDSAQDALQQFIDVLAEYPTGTYLKGGGGVFKGVQTVSVQALLNGDVRAGGDHAKEEPILISGWGYDRVSGQYETAGRIGRQLKHVALKPWRSGKKEITLTPLEDTRKDTKAYRLTVKELV